MFERVWLAAFPPSPFKLSCHQFKRMERGCSDNEVEQIMLLTESLVVRATSDTFYWEGCSHLRVSAIWNSIRDKRQEVPRQCRANLAFRPHSPGIFYYFMACLSLTGLRQKDRLLGKIPLNNPLCEFCKLEEVETRDHLFFGCRTIFEV